jgi:4-alpha-glucanotransferase
VLPDEQRKEVWSYLKRPGGGSADIARELIRLAWSSVAALAIVPLQDLLSLGKEARMNVPGATEGNWRWRFTEGMVSEEAFQWLEDLTKTSNRSAVFPEPETER